MELDDAKLTLVAENQLHSSGRMWLFNKAYITEFVYGGIDGAITTFAVVAGAAGANADLYWVLIFGFANLIADGFSMSVGSYFSVKAERDNFEKHQAIEYWEVENLREREVEEIREIYATKGFKGELLEKVVEVITSDKDVWVDAMMKEVGLDGSGLSGLTNGLSGAPARATDAGDETGSVETVSDKALEHLAGDTAAKTTGGQGSAGSKPESSDPAA